METKIIDGKEYRLVTVRNRAKWISRDGQAYNPKRKKQQAKKHLNPDGYPCFGGGVPVHLYVANAWVDGKFGGAEVDHIDYDRTNYNADNLRWVTHQENIKHSYIDTNHYSGKHSGIKNGRSTFTEEQIQRIRLMFDKGMTTAEVIKALHPEYTPKKRKNAWSKYNRIKTAETWSNLN